MRDDELMKDIEDRLQDVLYMIGKLGITQFEYKEKLSVMLEECISSTQSLEIIDLNKELQSNKQDDNKKYVLGDSKKIFGED